VLFAAFVALAIVDVATYILVTRAQLDQVDQDLERSHPPIERAASEPLADVEQAIRDIAPASYVEVRDASGSQVVVVPLHRAGAPAVQLDEDEPEPEPGAGDDDAAFATVHIPSTNESMRVRVSRQADGGVLLIGQSIEPLERTRNRLLGVLIVGTLGALAAVGIIGSWLVRAGLKPLTAVERSAAEITASDLDKRVPGDGAPTEVGRLACAINTMLDRLHGAFREREEVVDALQASEARMRRFVADASHELRTPLAAAAAYAELFDRGARNRPDDLERAMSGIRTETARMSELVDDLLLLAQLDERRPLERVEVDVADVVVEAMQVARTVAPDRQVSLRVDDVSVVDADRSRLRQVFDNLFGNVRAHTQAGTSCHVEIRRQGADAVIVVTDDGPGLTPDELASVTDRFFRADRSRARTSGGVGLGLSIVSAIVRAHGGTITLESPPEGGLRIIIRIPIAGTGEPSPLAATGELP
jgi:two-component system OmpR family sensor kinase